MKEGDNWVTAEGKTLDFIKASNAPENDTILWEPGCTYNLPTLRIHNNGNLALKYQVVITGIQGDAELNRAITWTITNTGATADEPATQTLETVNESANGTETPAVTSYSLAAGQSHTLTISGHMQESAGNEYQNKKIDGIAIAVLATQDTVEYDSNGNQYDANAAYSEYEIVSVDALPTEKSEDTHIILSKDVSGQGTLSGIYGGTKVGFIMNGGIFDGGNKTLTVENTTYGIQSNGGTIKNVTVRGAKRGIVLNSLQEDVYIDGVISDGNIYGINTAEHNGHRMIVTNSTINGWTSFAGLDSASFTNCTFGKSCGYEYLRPYSTTTLTDCQFNSDGFQLNAGGTEAYTITLTNCTKNGTAITAGNVVSLLVDTEDWNANATLIVNGTTVAVTPTP